MTLAVWQTGHALPALPTINGLTFRPVEENGNVEKIVQVEEYEVLRRFHIGQPIHDFS